MKFPAVRFLLAAVLACLPFAPAVHAQHPGNLDTGFDPGASTNSGAFAVAAQTDGKVLVGGFFTSAGGAARNGIARLDADGSLDTGFDPGAGAGGVIALAVQADGKILFGGFFSTVNGVARNHVARLNANGSLDTTFDPGAGANAVVRAVAVQPDGKVLPGGEFTAVGGAARTSLARLNADGSLDMGFDPGAGSGTAIYGVAVPASAKIVAGGYLSTVGGMTRNGVAQLNADGTLDTGFDPGTGTSGGNSRPGRGSACP